MIAWIVRAIWSAPPPVPAGTIISTGLVGSHAARPVPPREAMPRTGDLKYSAG
jgi:hypothetical protein